WRMVRRRRLLQWTPSSELPRGARAGSGQALLENLRMLWAGPTLAVATTVWLAMERPQALPGAALLLLLWLASPVIVWWDDMPPAEPRSDLDDAQRRFLRRIARRTWAFFETYVTPDDHCLPPDNVQLQPVARIAHRTSPTNIGFALLANVTARDLGYITPDAMLARIEATVTTLERLERHREHFYNWYDTQSLQPLAPRYISTVDSGNLVAQLMTLRGALLAMADEPPWPAAWFDGLADIAGLVRESLPAATIPAALNGLEHAVRMRLVPAAATTDRMRALEEIAALARDVEQGVQATTGVAVGTDPDEIHAAGEPLRWAQALVAQCEAGRAADLAWMHAGNETARPPATLGALAERGVEPARAMLEHARALAARVDALADCDVDFLYDSRRHLLSIGYNVDQRALDIGHYDLLASEARLGIFAAIARGQLPQESWFALGRLLTTFEGTPVLMSWSGSMFEYLMPPLILPSFRQTLLDQTCRAAVGRQVAYGRERGVPWGVSESGYNATDAALNYQYRAFGVPGLGLKRGLGDDLVIAPYACAMAAMYEPVAACANLKRLAGVGAAGEFGFHEAVDYTPQRVPRGRTCAVVRSFMAHHQGMGLLAIEQALGGSRMADYFCSDPGVQATLVLLHERVPRDVEPVNTESADAVTSVRGTAGKTEVAQRVFTDPNKPRPEVQLLSNGRYHVMVTQAGGGYSRCKDLAVTRWREDATCDNWGTYGFLRDLDAGVPNGGQAAAAWWSTTWQPSAGDPADYEAIFSEGRAEFRRRVAGIASHLEIAVSPEDPIELRRLRLKNTTRRTRTIEFTSYCEPVIMAQAADMQHPAFGKLFVQTEIIEPLATVLCNRRPRAPHDPSPWMFTLLAAHARRDDALSAVTHETDRARFIGRDGTLRAPAAMLAGGPLSNTQGSVLDPVAASRVTVVLEPDETVAIDVVIGLCDTREECLALVERYRDARLADRVFELAWTHGQVLLRQLNASEAEAQLYARLAGLVLFSQSALRADPALIRLNRRGQSGLWGYAISGDLPIVLVQVSDTSNMELVRQLVLAHAWWRLKGLAVDLVIWNEERDTYRQHLHEQILGLIAAGVDAHVVDRPGGIFVRHADQIPQEDRVLLQAVARVVLSDREGTLAEQIGLRLHSDRRSVQRALATSGASPADRRLQPFVPTRAVRAESGTPVRLPTGELVLFNGYGGFARDGREFVVAPPPGVRTPAPWVN
ncbi:MAG TPA: glucoamylase family protein, partial [Burkholderiaceae bacterium]|nr:glucoamylase family protein [Burkholderiaceae bacterium]